MRRKIISVVLMFVLLLLSAIPVGAIMTPIDDSEWSFLEDSGTLYIKADGELTWPRNFDQAPKWNTGEVRTLIIEEGTTRIMGDLFVGYAALEKVILPESLEYINGMTFKDCVSLKEIWIPNNVQFIGSGVFSQCTSLEKVHLPSSLNEIGPNAFSKCTSLKRISFPTSLRTVGKEAFSECTSLESVTLPEGLTKLGRRAFSGCTNLQRVVLPASLEDLGEQAFNLCEKLRSFTLQEGNCNFSCKDGILYSSDEKTLVAIPSGYVGKFTIPEGVERVGCFAAMSSSFITEIEIPDSLTTFDICSFLGCKRLCSLILPETVKEVKPGAFHAAAIYVKIENPDCRIPLMEDIDLGSERYWGWGSNFSSSHDTKIFGTPGTAAERYATRYQCKFFPLSEWSEPEQPLYEPLPAWTQEELPELTPDEPYDPTNMNYHDLSMFAWYYDEVRYAVKTGLMSGVGDNLFDPEGTMTRAMLVTVLWRYEGQPKGYQNTFTDVKDGIWYSDAVAWASANDIVNGVGGSRFDPDGEITRAQMATILFRYAEKKGVDTSKRGDLSVFPDGGSVESWSKDAIQWAVEERIINGSDGKLLPRESATRAQVAAILMRFVEKFLII